MEAERLPVATDRGERDGFLCGREFSLGDDKELPLRGLSMIRQSCVYHRMPSEDVKVGWTAEG